MIFTMINHDNPWNSPMTFMKNHTKNHPKPSQLALDSLRCSTWFHWHRHGISASIYFFQVIRSSYDQFIESTVVGTSDKSESKWEPNPRTQKNGLWTSGLHEISESSANTYHESLHFSSESQAIFCGVFWVFSSGNNITIQEIQEMFSPHLPKCRFWHRARPWSFYRTTWAKCWDPWDRTCDFSGDGKKRPRRIGVSVRFLVDFWWIYVGYIVRWGTPNQLLTGPAGPKKPGVSKKHHITTTAALDSGSTFWAIHWDLQLWKTTILLLGKSTIQITIFNSYT